MSDSLHKAKEFQLTSRCNSEPIILFTELRSEQNAGMASSWGSHGGRRVGRLGQLPSLHLQPRLRVETISMDVLLVARRLRQEAAPHRAQEREDLPNLHTPRIFKRIRDANSEGLT